MKISGISLKRVHGEKNLRAVCSINFDNVLVVHGIRLVEGKQGLFLSFPAKVKSDKKYLDIAHPIDSDFRQLLTDVVIEEYQKS